MDCDGFQVYNRGPRVDICDMKYGHILGSYESEENAMRVLDIIQNRCCRIRLLEVSSGYKISLSETKEFVFQMPEE